MIRLALLLALSVEPARATVPLPRPCSEILRFVDKYGEAAAIKWAAVAGWTAAQMAEAYKCRLQVKK